MMSKAEKEIQDYLSIIYKVEMGEVSLDDSPEIFGAYHDATKYMAHHPSEFPLESVSYLLPVFDDKRFINPDQVKLMEMILGIAYSYGEKGFNFFIKHFCLIPDTGRFVGIQSALRMLIDWDDDYSVLLSKVLPKQTDEVKNKIFQKLKGAEIDEVGNIDPQYLAWKEKFINIMNSASSGPKSL